jgi:CDGSH-type Zn-finger protein
MARLVRFDAAKPIKIDPATWPRDEQGNLRVLSICACGISAKFPLCDGAHKACNTEEAGCTYTYDIATRSVQSVTRPATADNNTPNAQNPADTQRER